MDYLKDHPQIAILSAVTSAVVPYIDAIGKVAQFVAVVGGAIIVILTTYLKIQEVRELKKRLKDERENNH
jgi:hypothetical protein